MKFTKFFLSVILIIGIMVAGSVWAAAAQSAQQQTVSSLQAGQANTSAELEQYFQKAHEEYSKNATEQCLHKDGYRQYFRKWAKKPAEVAVEAAGHSRWQQGQRMWCGMDQ